MNNNDATNMASTLREIAGDDVEFIDELVDSFLHDTDETLDSLEESIGRDDLKAVAKLAHRLKGSSGTMGAESIRYLCEQLEQCIAQGSLNGADTLVAHMRTVFSATRSSLPQELSESSAAAQATPEAASLH